MASREAIYGTMAQLKQYRLDKLRNKPLSEIQWAKVSRKILDDLDKATETFIMVGGRAFRSSIHREALVHFLENTLEKDFSREDLNHIAFARILKEPKTAVTMRIDPEVGDRLKAFFLKWDKYNLVISDIAQEAFFRYYDVLMAKVKEMQDNPTGIQDPILRKEYEDHLAKNDPLNGL